jgi:glycosyltransferase involved in cell wall biosynthesis
MADGTTMDILLASDSSEPSGVGRHMMTLAKGLAGTHRVTLAFSSEPGGRSFADLARTSGLTAETLDMSERACIARLIARQRPDVLHVHAGIGWEGQGLTDEGHLAGAAVVRTEHLPWLITDSEQEAVYCCSAKTVDAFIAVSASSAATWEPILGRCRPDARLFTIRNGVGVPRPALARGDVRAALGVGTGETLLLCVARFTPQKDHATLLDAFARLRERGHPLSLALVGDGPERGRCEAQVEAAGTEGAIFLGARDDVPDLLAAADALVLASQFEGLPLVVLEAMAAGTPVVASRIGGMVEALGSDHPFLCGGGLRRRAAQAL